jgi:hypothetical protein
MISIQLLGRLGNHMWQYAVCRTVAEKNGYEFHIPRNFLGSDMFGCSLGIEKDSTFKIFFDSYKINSRLAQFYNPNIFRIDDYTKLIGFYQCDRYLLENKGNIQRWFTQKNINQNLIAEFFLNENICVINFRGGDYKELAVRYLDESYWKHSIAEMLKVNPAMQFKVITDDIDAARTFFPSYPTYHFGAEEDFSIISHAKYLIIANSTFSWWAAWLNKSLKMVIAPKYWMKYNESSGWWVPGESITRGFHYMGKEGLLLTSSSCINEFNQSNLSYKDFPY